MAPHSSTLAWKIPWTDKPGRLHPWGHKELDTTERLHFSLHLYRLQEQGQYHKSVQYFKSSSVSRKCVLNVENGSLWLVEFKMTF